MTNKEQYALLCEQYPDINIFMQEWWLSAVCAGKQWDVFFCRDEKGEICAAMPYLFRKRMLFKYILMPQQTQTGGIWIRPDMRDSIQKVKEICTDMAQQLKALKLSYYYQQYTIGSPAPDAMRNLGFKIKERTTYRIEDLSNLDKIIDAFSKNKKRQLQKALSLNVKEDMSEEEFYRFHTQCLALQKKKITYTREFFLVLYRKSIAHNQGKIIAIKDNDGNIHAAVFLVWDKRQMYYLIPCYDPNYKDSGAGALLVLEAIKLARKVTAAFDFEGSMIKGVANHYKQFGPQAFTYHSVRRYYNPLFWFAVAFNNLK